MFRTLSSAVAALTGRWFDALCGSGAARLRHDRRSAAGGCRTPVGRCALRAAAVCLLIGCPAAVALGQADEAKSADDGTPDVAAEEEPTSTSEAAKSEDDSPGVFLKGEALREYRRWQQSRNGPAYSITRVDLEGRVAGGDRAELKALIEVQVNVEDRDVLVPLNLQEATLDDHSYRGEGEASPALDADRESGYRWWFRGRGKHELELSLIVPVKKQLPGRRLQLTIPETVVSRLGLHVPVENLKVKAAPKDAWIKTTVREEGTDLQVQWFGSRLDLSWQPLPDQYPEKAVLQSRTVMTVEMTSESVILRATTRIQALQGSSSEIRLRLPADFELLDVEGKHYSNHELTVGNHVVVQLAEPVSNSEPTELKWILEAPFPDERGTLTLDGFELDRARRQTGQIAIMGLDEFRVSRREGDDRYVHRMNVGDPAAEEGVTKAYAFYRQPFRLVLELDQHEPGFSFRPELQLEVTGERLVLDARYAFDVYRGALREVPVAWPHFEDEGWTIESVEPLALVDPEKITEGPVDGVLQVPLVRTTQRTFEIRIRASRPVPADAQAFDLTLPVVEAPGRRPTAVTLIPAENVEVDLVASQETTARPVQATGPLAGELPNEFDPSRRATWEVESPQHAFSATVRVHEREISTRTAAVAELQQNAVRITQEVLYDVSWGRLSQIALKVPAELGQQVLFVTEQGEELRPSWRTSNGSSSSEARLALPEGVRGQFRLTAEFLIELQEEPVPGRRLAVSLPLLQSIESAFESTTVEFRHGNHLQAALSGEADWQPQSSAPLSSRWTAEGPATQATLQVSVRTGEAAQDYVVRKALIESVLDSGGTVVSRARFLIDGPVSTVVLDIPHEEVQVDAIRWDGQELGASRISEVPASPARLQLRVSDSPLEGRHLLTVGFHANRDKPFGWFGPHRLAAPTVSSGAWTEQSLWVVTVPGNQLLFRQPSRWTPQFRWLRGTVLWSRQPRAEYASPEDWLNSSEAGSSAGSGEPLPGASTGNRYHFGRFGGAPQIELATMSLPFVVFLGAGLAAVAGLMLLYVPAIRNVLSLLTAACLVAFVALWYPEPVKLLMQPALLGLVLASLGAVVHRLLNREKPEPLVTLSSPSDFASPSAPAPSSAERSFSVGAGSEDPTALRAAPSNQREPVSASDSGSH